MQRWRSLVETAKHQIYISQVKDPFLNLSIENFLLQKSAPHSTILFLYVNRNCVVIGRNQNPWLEVDLRRLQENKGELVRRRSGGGTVFHDEGNLNYSVICPTANFTRDKHADMVTKAIRPLNNRVRVNERHDIVLDRGPLLPDSEKPPKSDMHRSEYAVNERPSLKVSGSAYKMIRNRCLHHGTCLVYLSNLGALKSNLNAPARAFIRARGVDSVRSLVGTLFNYKPSHEIVSDETFIVYNTMKVQETIASEFMNMYGLQRKSTKENLFTKAPSTPATWSKDDWAGGVVGAETLEIPEIAEGVKELKSPQWIYGQTPEFTLSSQAHIEDGQIGFNATARFGLKAVSLKARGGIITEAKILHSSEGNSSTGQTSFEGALKGRHINEVENFVDVFYENKLSGEDTFDAMTWLNTMFAKATSDSPRHLGLPRKDSTFRWESSPKESLSTES